MFARFKGMLIEVGWRLFGCLGRCLLAGLKATMRIEHHGTEHLQRLLDEGTPHIIAFWHSRLLLMPYVYPHPHEVHIMISEHKDGEMIARVVERFGYHTVRGSTTHGGSKALKSMVRIARQGKVNCITPDGPRGPAQKAQMGIIALAKLSSAAIIPVSFGTSKAKLLNSWDRFMVPLPFSGGLFLWGEPIFVPSQADEVQLEEKRKALEASLNRLTEQVDSYFKR